MNKPPILRKLNHVAWRCIDAQETCKFYEGVLGLPLAHTVTSDHVPSTGEYAPYFHLFFELGDGSYVAFFDIRDGKGATQSEDMPKWVHHFAFEVNTRDEVEAMRARLKAAGVDVIGITDHGFINSIYFFDPNGLRLEVTVRTETQAYMDEAKNHSHAALAKWNAEKHGVAAA
ncbi:MAG: VOC family protein [Ramlibacter sp.]